MLIFIWFYGFRAMLLRSHPIFSEVLFLQSETDYFNGIQMTTLQYIERKKHGTLKGNSL